MNEIVKKRIKIFEDRLADLGVDKMRYEELAKGNKRYIRLVRDTIENMRYATLALDDILKDVVAEGNKAGFKLDND